MTPSEEILTLERGALDRWAKGDPWGFVEISAPDVVYFDPFVPRRIDGREALAAYYRPIEGKISIARYEIIDPAVTQSGGMAVLTFNFHLLRRQRGLLSLELHRGVPPRRRRLAHHSDALVLHRSWTTETLSKPSSIRRAFA